MRVILFFDLPSVYAKDKKRYILFRKNLINDGFIMLQESVYSKIALNNQKSELIINKVKKYAPNKGSIQILVVTEKQYVSMRYITGKNNSKIIDNEERLIVL